MHNIISLLLFIFFVTVSFIKTLKKYSASKFIPQKSTSPSGKLSIEYIVEYVMSIEYIVEYVMSIEYIVEYVMSIQNL